MGKITVVDIVLRLLGAVIVGFAVGAQRARTSHPAGIRTHILVALGSCVVMVTSCIMYEQTIAVFGTTPSDPARLGAQVINGIGFLGAGTILVTKDNQVKGLTTAAGLWASACLGLAIGAGFFEGAIMAVAIIVVSMYFFANLKHELQSQSRVLSIYVEVKSLVYLGDVLKIVRDQGGTIIEMNIDDDRGKKRLIYDAEIVIRLAPEMTPDTMLACVSQVEHVKHVHEL